MKRKTEQAGKVMRMRYAYCTVAVLMTLLALLAWGCTSQDMTETRSQAVDEPIEELAYGADICDFSGEPIETVRYGGRLELNSGAVYDFMSVECLAGFYLSLAEPSRVRALKVVDFTHGKRLIGVEEAVFLNSPLRPSPNGLFLTAIEAADKKMVTYIYDAYPGPLLEWEDVLKLVNESWGLQSGLAEVVM